MSTIDGASHGPLILIRGAGATGSGVAHQLIRAGFWVAMTELERPLLTRTTVSYGLCVYYTTVFIDGILAYKASPDADSINTLLNANMLPIVIDPEGKLIDLLNPQVIVDARMAESNLGTKITDAPLVIGLGSGFTAEIDCHAVIETSPEQSVGHVIWQGKAASAAYSESDECVLLAPTDGTLTQFVQIGEFARKGTLIARVGDVPISAPTDGVLCGLIDYDSHVEAGARIGYFDPHATRKQCFIMSSTVLAIGDGVVKALWGSGIISHKD
jgi:xanthine dehydrogenase accessory factor